jgi:hypothetical protein
MSNTSELMSHASPALFGLSALLSGLGSIAAAKAKASSDAKNNAAPEDAQMKTQAQTMLIGNSLEAAFLLLGALVIGSAGISAGRAGHKGLRAYMPRFNRN